MNKDLIIKTTVIKENGKINFKTLNKNLNFKDFISYKFYIWDTYGIDIYLNDFLSSHQEETKSFHNSSQKQEHETDENRNTNPTFKQTGCLDNGRIYYLKKVGLDLQIQIYYNNVLYSGILQEGTLK